MNFIGFYKLLSKSLMYSTVYLKNFLTIPLKPVVQWPQNHKMSITKVVRYVSGVTTIYLGSPLDPWGPGGTRGGPQGSI